MLVDIINDIVTVIDVGLFSSKNTSYNTYDYITTEVNDFILTTEFGENLIT